MKTLNWLAILLALCLFASFTVVACGDDDDDDDDSSGDDDDDDDVSGDTWADSSSGLTWQVTPSSDYLDWEGAKTYCDTLSLDGGGWHLPTVSELRTLIRGCEATLTGGSCGVTDDCTFLSCCNMPCLNGCGLMAGPGSGGAYWPDGMPGEIHDYWSSSALADDDLDFAAAWVVGFSTGVVHNSSINNSHANYARCVR